MNIPTPSILKKGASVYGGPTLITMAQDMTGKVFHGIPMMTGDDIYNEMMLEVAEWVALGAKADCQRTFYELITVWYEMTDPSGTIYRMLATLNVNRINALYIGNLAEETIPAGGGGGGFSITIKGRIVDTLGNPLAGQKVDVQDPRGVGLGGYNKSDGTFEVGFGSTIAGTATVTDLNWGVTKKVNVTGAGVYDIGDFAMPYTPPSPPPPTPTSVIIQGKVIDGDTGNIVSGAVVIVNYTGWSNKTITDAAGAYSAEFHWPGSVQKASVSASYGRKNGSQMQDIPDVGVYNISIKISPLSQPPPYGQIDLRPVQVT
jgi:hypothetical protein